MSARWRGYSHPELYTLINSGPGPQASDAQTAYWQALSKELQDVDTQLNSALNGLKATWQGTASDTANTGMSPLQQWAGDAQTASGVMRASAEDQAQFIGSARAEMPEPVEVTTPAPSVWDYATAAGAALTGNPGPAAAVAGQALDREHQEAAQNAAADKAVDTMNTYQENSTWNSNTLGTFVAPPDVVVSVPGSGSGTTPGGQIGGWMTGGSYTLPGSTTDSGTITTPRGTGGGSGSRPPSTSGGGSTVTLPPGAGAGTGGSGWQPPVNTGTDPSSFVPLPPGSGGGGSVPAQPNLPNSTLPGLPGGGGPNPGSHGNFPLPANSYPGGPGFGPGEGPSPDGRSGGLPGRGLSGGFGPDGARGGAGGPGSSGLDGARAGSQQPLGRGGTAGTDEGAFGRGGAGAEAGGRGSGMGGGGPMGGGRGAGDDDDEHFAADYLLETTDVFGDDRMVSPAVIGEDPTTDEK